MKVGATNVSGIIIFIYFKYLELYLVIVFLKWHYRKWVMYATFWGTNAKCL